VGYRDRGGVRSLGRRKRKVGQGRRRLRRNDFWSSEEKGERDGGAPDALKKEITDRET